MKDKQIYITIHQGFVLVSQIEELKKNPYFRDPIAESFTKDVYDQATNITVNSINLSSNILQKLQRNGDKIKIPESKFAYITRLTGIDVFDEEVMAQFPEKVNEIDSSIQNNNPRLR